MDEDSKMKRLFAIGLSLLMLVGFSADAVAWNKADLDKLRKTNNCPGCNLVAAKLQGANLESANLTGAYLGGSNLTGANLSGATLIKAGMSRVNWQGVNLAGADLRLATLGGKLQGANLQAANLLGARLGGAKLQGANLRGANLRGANLRGANLTGADLTGANLSGASICHTIMPDGSTDTSGCPAVVTFVPSTPPSNAVQIWCVARGSLSRTYEEACETNGGEVITSSEAKEIERGYYYCHDPQINKWYWKMLQGKQYCGNGERIVSMEEYYSLWCVDSDRVEIVQIKPHFCDNRGGKLFATWTEADAEFGRIGGASAVPSTPTPPTAVTWNEADLAKLRKTNECLSCDLVRVNLEGAILSKANLANANLSEANLKHTNLFWANLSGANLSYGRLMSANLTGANLTGANLTNALLFKTKLTNANLTKAILTGADLSRANLLDANLTGANLKYANLYRTNLTGAIRCQTIMPDGSTDNSGCGAVATPSVPPKKEEPQPQPKPESKAEPPPLKLLGTGTGFLVNKEYIVTADHVVDGCNEVTVRHKHKEYWTDVAARDPSNDLGLLRLEEPFSDTAKLRGGKAVRLGEVISTYGYPLFGELSDSAKITQGNINSLAGIGNDSRTIQFDAPTQPGNSGGPVLDSSGNVVGVVSHGLSKKYADQSGHIAQNVNFAVKSYLVEGFLSSNNVSFEKAESTEKLELPDIAEKAEKFTVLVGCWE